MCRRFGTLPYPSLWAMDHTPYEDGTECSETLEHKIHTPGNHPKKECSMRVFEIRKIIAFGLYEIYVEC
jgi:hypothetical protein